MNTKRIIALLIAAIMVLSLIPVMAISTSAATEGDWITYQGADAYPDPNEEDPDPDAVYPPEAGYEYTADGFTVIQPNWTGITPFMTVSTKQTVNLKDGVYLEFRVDDYSYGWNAEGTNVDHWISVSLNTGTTEADGSVNGKVRPPETRFGGGWNTLLRSNGTGTGPSVPCFTTPDTEDATGTFLPYGQQSVTATLDDEDREIYVIEVTWDDVTGYSIKVNGVEHCDAATSTKLNDLAPDGEYFIGITMMDTVIGGSAGLTVTKFGTSADTATKPVGSDSKAPQENNIVIADIADPSTVPENTPAILWNPDTYNLKTGNNCVFSVLGDNTWRGDASEAAVNFSLNAKNAWSYEVTDFPVFCIMLRNFWVDTGTLWYAAGNVASASNGYTLPFSVYDGEMYDVGDDEYIFIPMDLTDLIDGRIHGMRVDMAMPDADTREFDVCFAGMFRSEEEAYAYVEAWFAEMNIETEAPEEDTTAAPADETTAAPTETTAAPAETDPVKEGCGSVIGVSAVAILAAAAAAVALKKKE